MVYKLARLISIPIITILLVFNFRRILFTFTILFYKGRSKEKSRAKLDSTPPVLILVACRDEVQMIPGLSQAIWQLNYPRERYQVVLIDDGSTDGTGQIMEQCAKQKTGWHVLCLQKNMGKASALNVALARYPFGDIIYILDADHRPNPQALSRAVRYFEDPQVAGITGFTKVLNPTASASAYYAATESYINQLVTVRAKDRLGLAPSLLGSNCGYRRETLLKAGGFRPGAFSEDSDLTVSFYQSGYRVRFAEDVISYQQVPQTIPGYMKQHIRWSRGLNDVAKAQSLNILRNPNLSFPLRLELLLFTAGYLDRIALAGAGVLTLLSTFSKGHFHFSNKILFLALFTPLVQIIALFIKERMNTAMWIRLPLLPFFFVLDIFTSIRAMLDTILNRSRTWTKTERVTELSP